MRNKIWEKMAFLRNKRNFLLLNVAKREKLDLLRLAGLLKTIQATLKSVIQKNSQNILSKIFCPALNSLTKLQMRLKLFKHCKVERRGVSRIESDI